MTTLEIIIVVILSAWFIASVFYVVFNRLLSKVTNRWDIFRWLSAYQLFSETERHFRLSYRDALANNVTTEWQVIPMLVRQRWYHMFWFPEALIYKLINSFVDDLVRFWEAKQNTTASEKISERFIYRVVLRFVWRCPVNENTQARQFKIEETSGYVTNKTIEEIFVSTFHER